MAITSPKPKSFKELIRDKYYHVPLYQRPYDWGVDQVSELWNDINVNDPGYFLGITIFRLDKELKDPHSSKLEVVDGQQRLTSLILLVRAAVEVLESIGEKLVSSEFQKEYIAQRPAGEERSVYTLKLSKRDNSKFEGILSGQQPLAKKGPSSWRNLEKTTQFFKEKIDQLAKEKGKRGVIEFLNNKVLRLSFLEVLLESDSDVYQFFETINDRGMDLSIADLVKNRVCSEAQKQGISVEDSAQTIDRVSSEIGSGKLKTFLLHYCWANNDEADPTPKKKLMEWYGKHISQSSDIQAFLNQLEKYALQYYLYFVDPDRCTDPEKKAIFTYLDALGATRCYPLLLAGIDGLDNKSFLRLCKTTEILTFRHSTILKKDAKVLEGIFHKTIKDIRKKKPIDEILQNLIRHDSMKNDNQFKLAFKDFIPASHKIARYALWKIEEFKVGKKQIRLDWDSLTLEHILAEKLNWEGKEEYLERLGNLTLLSSPMNSEAANKPFKEKNKNVYKKEKRIELTKELTILNDFTKETIVSRQDDLSKLISKIWDPKNV
jgi:hypothetical protein